MSDHVPDPDDNRALSAQPAIVLVRPQLGENIGAAARAMANFGLDQLRLVAPRDGWPNADAERNASGAPGVLDNVTLHEDTPGAVADLQFLVATTARARDMVKPVLTPEQAIAVTRERLAAGERCGIIFGPERTGLENDEVALADAIVMAPVNPRFASINLAQAVLLIGYEWIKSEPAASIGRHTATDGIAGPGEHLRRSQRATREELIGFLEHLERELDAHGFFKAQHMRALMVRNLRNIFTRAPLTEQEVRTLRGVVASLTDTHKKGRGAP